jgi:hypothetical protein
MEKARNFESEGFMCLRVGLRACVGYRLSGWRKDGETLPAEFWIVSNCFKIYFKLLTQKRLRNSWPSFPWCSVWPLSHLMAILDKQVFSVYLTLEARYECNLLSSSLCKISDQLIPHLSVDSDSLERVYHE